jgi:hypothetical protein
VGRFNMKDDQTGYVPVCVSVVGINFFRIRFNSLVVLKDNDRSSNLPASYFVSPCSLKHLDTGGQVGNFGRRLSATQMLKPTRGNYSLIVDPFKREFCTPWMT